MKIPLIGCLLLWSVINSRAFAQPGVPDADQSHGTFVLQQIVADRPDMEAVLEANPALVSWLNGQFAKDAVGDRLYWDNGLPASHHADFLPPTGQNRGFIRVTADGRVNSLDKAALLIYVLTSVASWQGRYELVTEATEGRIDRNEFISKYLRLDFDVKVTTKGLLKRFDFPARVSNNTPYTSMFLAQDERFDSYEAKLRATSRNPLNEMDLTASHYDTAIAPNVRKNGLGSVP